MPTALRRQNTGQSEKEAARRQQCLARDLVRRRRRCRARSLHSSSAHAGEYDHTYKDGEEAILWVNKVGPYHNPQETYLYYSLPFC